MDNVCRLCLKENVSLVSIFGRNKGDISEDSLANRILLICGILVKPEDEKDNLPNRICYSCNETVEKACELRNTSMKNDRLLREKVPPPVFIKVEDEECVVKLEPSIYFDMNDSGSCTSEEPISQHQRGRFFCDLCPEISSTKTKIERHLRSEHLSAHLCRLCSNPFKSNDTMQRHMRKIHKSKEYYACHECNVFFRINSQFQKHKELHEMFNKIASQDSTKCYQCKVCSKTFDDKNSERLLDHITYHKKRTRKVQRNQKGSESFICPHCGNMYQARQHLNQHMKRHFNEFPCPNCPAKFKARSELNKHSVVHTTERNFICEICSKTFKAKRILRKHQKRHETTAVKQFQCNYCQLSVMSKYSLNRHMLIHTGEKKFSCTYCDSSFIQKNELNKHLRLHIGENTYKCDTSGCTEAFRLLADLRIHQQVHFERTKIAA